MNICLNIGCGGETRFENNANTKWINIDARSNVGADLVIDAKKLPYEANSIARIASVHMLEHLPRHDVKTALIEWYRVLKPNGVIDIEVPNVDLTMASYLEAVRTGNTALEDKRIENIYGRQFFPGDQHCWGFNFRRLKLLLESVGFKNVREIDEYSYHRSEEPVLRVWADK